MYLTKIFPFVWRQSGICAQTRAFLTQVLFRKHHFPVASAQVPRCHVEHRQSTAGGVLLISQLLVTLSWRQMELFSECAFLQELKCFHLAGGER